jgi:hypothetical protein
MTLAKACRHITNFTAAHESRVSRLGQDRIAYSDQHIEIDNRLCWFLGLLDKMYGHDAFYVQLVRDRSEVASSFMRRWPTALPPWQRLARLRVDPLRGGIISAFSFGIISGRYEWSDAERRALCEFYVDTVNSNIDCFLRDKPLKIRMCVDSFREDFTRFWDAIGAEGDLAHALSELDQRYNSSEESRRRGIPWASRSKRVQLGRR